VTRLRVDVTVAIDVDRDAWASAYDLDGDAAIRDDIRRHVLQLVAVALTGVAGANVTLHPEPTTDGTIVVL
jgi:hypothetical protein